MNKTVKTGLAGLLLALSGCCPQPDKTEEMNLRLRNAELSNHVMFLEAELSLLKNEYKQSNENFNPSLPLYTTPFMMQKDLDPELEITKIHCYPRPFINDYLTERYKGYTMIISIPDSNITAVYNPNVLKQEYFDLRIIEKDFNGKHKIEIFMKKDDNQVLIYSANAFFQKNPELDKKSFDF